MRPPGGKWREFDSFEDPLAWAESANASWRRSAATSWKWARRALQASRGNVESLGPLGLRWGGLSIWMHACCWSAGRLRTARHRSRPSSWWPRARGDEPSQVGPLWLDRRSGPAHAGMNRGGRAAGSRRTLACKNQKVNRPPACTYLSGCTNCLYVLVWSTCFSDSRGRKSTCFSDSRGRKSLHVSPMENSLNHSGLWTTTAAALRGRRSRVCAARC